MSVKDAMQRVALHTAYEYLDRDPETNIPRLLDLVGLLDRDKSLSRPLERLRTSLSDTQSNWSKLVKSLWSDVETGIRETVFTNFIVNSCILSDRERRVAQERLNCPVPWVLVLAPGGEDAAARPESDTLGFEELDDVIEQGKALGIYSYLFSGSEPLACRDELIALCNKHSNCQFAVVTGGQGIDGDFADDLLRVQNLMPILKIRDPEGRHGACREAMELLHAKRILFGAACHVTQENAALLGSESFVDGLIERGAKCALYYEGGRRPMPQELQRAKLQQQLKIYRDTKPLYTLEAWSTQPAAEANASLQKPGRSCLYINARGDVASCETVNVRSSSLEACLQSPLARGWNTSQPFGIQLLGHSFC